MPKYEYIIVKSRSLLDQKQLNQYGDKGWVLVTVMKEQLITESGIGNEFQYIFKQRYRYIEDGHPMMG